MEKEVLKLLENGKALSFFEISEALGYSKDMDEHLAMVLTNLVNNYDLTLTNKNRYMLFRLNEKNKNMVKGRFIETKGEFGFVRVDGMSEDIFIHGTVIRAHQVLLKRPLQVMFMNCIRPRYSLTIKSTVRLKTSTKHSL